MLISQLRPDYFHPMRSFIILSIWEFDIQCPALFSSKAKDVYKRQLLLRLAALFSPGMLLTVQILLIFYCLAGTTLVREVRMAVSYTHLDVYKRQGIFLLNHVINKTVMS